MASTLRIQTTIDMVASLLPFTAPIPFDFFLTYDIVAASEISILNNTIDQPLGVIGPTGFTTIQSFVLLTNGVISLKFGSSFGSPITLTGPNACAMMIGTTLTQILVTNTSGATVIAFLVAGGT